MTPPYGAVPLLFAKPTSASSNAKSIEHDWTDKAKTGAVVESLARKPRGPIKLLFRKTKPTKEEKKVRKEDEAWDCVFTVTVEECTNWVFVHSSECYRERAGSEGADETVWTHVTLLVLSAVPVAGWDMCVCMHMRVAVLIFLFRMHSCKRKENIPHSLEDMRKSYLYSVYIFVDFCVD